MHLSGEFLEQDRLKGLVERYSEFITFPIFVHTSKTETVEVPVEEEEEEDDEPDSKDDEKKDDDADADKKDGEEDKDELEAEDEEEEEADEKGKTKSEQRTTWSWVRVNEQTPIWTKAQADITDDEYTKFYKSISKDTSVRDCRMLYLLTPNRTVHRALRNKTKHNHQ